MAVVHSDKNEPTTSVIVASGSYLYVYRNLKPFYKFSLPPLETNQIELDAWLRYKENKINLTTLEELLNNLRLDLGPRIVTSRSSMFLSLPDDAKLSFADTYKNQQLKKMNVITCLGTLKKTVSEEYASSCLVIGTEHQDVYILEIEAFTILQTVRYCKLLKITLNYSYFLIKRRPCPVCPCSLTLVAYMMSSIVFFLLAATLMSILLKEVTTEVDYVYNSIRMQLVCQELARTFTWLLWIAH